MSVGSISGSSSSRSSSSASSSSASQSSRGSEESRTSKGSRTSSADRFSRSSFEAAPAQGNPKAKAGAQSQTAFDLRNPKGVAFQGEFQAPLHDKRILRSEIPGSTRTTIPSNYGDVQAHVLTREAYLDAASKGLIPEGSVVFQTRHGWDYGDKPYGNDVGIVRNGAIFNYEQNNTMAIYSGLVSAVVLHPN